MMEWWYLYFSAFFLFYIFLMIEYRQRRMLMKKIKDRRKGVKSVMPTELIREFIGKEVMITMYSEMSAVQGTIVSIEGNWIKVEEKKKIRLINGDMIKDISMKR